MTYFIDFIIILGVVSMIFTPIILIIHLVINSKYWDKIEKYLDEIAEHYKNQ